MFAMYEHEYRATLTALPDAIYIVLQYLNSPSGSEYPLVEALDAAKDIYEIAQGISHRGNILQIRNIKYGTPSFKFQQYSAKSLIDVCANAHKREAAKKGVSVIVDESVGRLPNIVTDRSAFTTVMTQLIDNAVKYSHSDKFVEITGKRSDGRILISVEDFGLGIKPKQAHLIYREDFRGDRSRKAVGAPGEGRGLYIARQYVDGLGGKISHQQSSGTRDQSSNRLEGWRVKFTVELPLNPGGTT